MDKGLISMEQLYLSNNNLTRRETEIVSCLLRGRSLRSVCERLHISYNTGKTHMKSVYRKLEVSNRDELLDWAEDHSKNY
ncbi:MAG: response regulator transcription factor [Raoultibacter sp.]